MTTRNSTAPDGPPAIKVHKLCKTYDGSAALAISDVSFEVGRGEIFTLLGPSGCGKTTTLRLIAGLETPDSGNIHFGDNLVTARHVMVPPDRRTLGMVFQSGAVWPHMTVQQNVAFPLKGRCLKRAEINRRVAEILELVNLQGLEDRASPQLSGGQRQRVALARALVTEPDILLLDEPFNSLDSSLREQMRNDIKQLQRRLQITILFVTHDQSEALDLSDRIGLMCNGVLQQYGSPRQLYEHPTNEFVRNFLGKSVLFRRARKETGQDDAAGRTAGTEDRKWPL
jgi:iron(III) transport system ATP-binding protein